jgi:uncharacterized protein YejL (UPF0352 family)
MGGIKMNDKDFGFDERVEKILNTIVKDMFKKQISVELSSMQWARVTSILHAAERSAKHDNLIEEAEILHNTAEEIMDQIAATMASKTFGNKL